MSEGELKKLRLIAYSDPEFTTAIDDGTFYTLINPESYKYKYKIENNDDQAPGTSAGARNFSKSLPEEIELEFLFDRTGVIIDNSGGNKKTYTDEGEGVVEDLEKFKRIVLEYQGDEHKPNYVKISWGTLLFKGSLEEMTINYKLFKPDGTPLRAVASVKFVGFVEDDLRVAKENNQSPDVSHYYQMKEGETLPYVCHKFYGDSMYYQAVASANNIISFRDIKTGTQLVFPPIEKIQ